MAKSSKDLPRGVSYTSDSKISPYRATFTKNGKILSKYCKTLEEAIKTRKNRENIYGKPKNRALDKENLEGKQFGKLTVRRRLQQKDKYGSFYWECQCDCGNFINVTSKSLKYGDVVRCNQCRKNYLQKSGVNTRVSDVQIDGVQILRFNDKTYKNNKSGFKGVMLDKRHNKYYAQLTVKGKVYTKSGFDTAEDAYYNGRLVLEDKYLPPKEDREKLRKEVKGKKKED
ncbi:hypothetical protein [Anaerococcus marasmi]|uniref:hypothetical protein n=1 Tax=Anaerococcus marasmi TaxID=2057797 RepID=UPI000CF90426|nr:hypothetical protein [Anaerococcus marasmi]